MELIFDEEMIREELRRLDRKTGLHGADLRIKFGKTRAKLGHFSYRDPDQLEFYFSNYYFLNPTHPVEEKLDTIRHEYAHYMDYMLNGSSSHGASWKRCCAVVGAFPARCFNQQRSNAFLQKHEKERQMNEKYDGYAPEDKIIHPAFGEGTIVEVIGEGVARIARVCFNGTDSKNLAISWIDANCKKC